MFWIKNKKIRSNTPANPIFVSISVGFKGVYFSRTCFTDVRYVVHNNTINTNQEVDKGLDISNFVETKGMKRKLNRKKRTGNSQSDT